MRMKLFKQEIVREKRRPSCHWNLSKFKASMRIFGPKPTNPLVNQCSIYMANQHLLPLLHQSSLDNWPNPTSKLSQPDISPVASTTQFLMRPHILPDLVVWCNQRKNDRKRKKPRGAEGRLSWGQVFSSPLSLLQLLSIHLTAFYRPLLCGFCHQFLKSTIWKEIK